MIPFQVQRRRHFPPRLMALSDDYRQAPVSPSP